MCQMPVNVKGIIETPCTDKEGKHVKAVKGKQSFHGQSMGPGPMGFPSPSGIQKIQLTVSDSVRLRIPSSVLRYSVYE